MEPSLTLLQNPNTPPVAQRVVCEGSGLLADKNIFWQLIAKPKLRNITVCHSQGVRCGEGLGWRGASRRSRRAPLGWTNGPSDCKQKDGLVENLWKIRPKMVLSRVGLLFSECTSRSDLFIQLGCLFSILTFLPNQVVATSAQLNQDIRSQIRRSQSIIV